MAWLRGFCRRDRHIGRLAQRSRGIGLGLIGLCLGPSLFEGQRLGGVGVGIRVGCGMSIGIVASLGTGAGTNARIGLATRLIARQRLVPLLVRSLALAIPPFKVIDIHTGRPLGLASTQLLALYPQKAPALTRTGQENRPNNRRLSSISRFSSNVVTVWAAGQQRNVTKGLSLCHIARAARMAGSLRASRSQGASCSGWPCR